jgi:hypothetical protein
MQSDAHVHRPATQPAGVSRVGTLTEAGRIDFINVVKTALGNKYLAPIIGYSDEMLVARYNEAKADCRTARTRSAIGWAAFAIIGVILVIVDGGASSEARAV